MKRLLAVVTIFLGMIVPVGLLSQAPASARTTLNCSSIYGNGGPYNGVEDGYAYCTVNAPPTNYTSYSVCIYVSQDGFNWQIDTAHGVAFAACDNADNSYEQVALGDRKPGGWYYRSQSYAYDVYAGGCCYTLVWNEWYDVG